MNEYEEKANEFLTSTKTGFSSEFKEFNSMPWDKDGQKRNIFTIELYNDKGKYTFDFGASLNNSLTNPSDVLSVGKEIDFKYTRRFKGLNNEYLSYSQKIKTIDLKNAKNWNDVAKLINKKAVIKEHADFINSNIHEFYGKPNILPVEGRFGSNGWFEEIVQALLRKTTELSAKNWGEPIRNNVITHPTKYDVLSCLTTYDPGTFENFCLEFGYDNDSISALRTYNAVVSEWDNVSMLFTEEELEKLREIQ